MIGKEWMLITAGTVSDCNTMTASWGGLGVIWGKPSATVYIRQSRYTKEFVDRKNGLQSLYLTSLPAGLKPLRKGVREGL